MEKSLEKVKAASRIIMNATESQKNDVLMNIVTLLKEHREQIYTKNIKDVEYAKSSGLQTAMIDRLTLDDKRFESMLNGVLDIVNQNDPVGSIDEGFKRPNDLIIYKTRVPIGVIGIIYESRPNVTIDAAALCIKSGNASILKGGKESANTNRILSNITREALMNAGLDKNAVLLFEDPERLYITKLLKAKDYIDLIIPRGGEGLINFVTENSLIPIVKHDKGLCHTYIDVDADIDKAISIAYNAKVNRPGVCNAMETLLINVNIAGKVLPRLTSLYNKAGVEIRGCELTCKYAHVIQADEKDWDTEYLDLIISIKIVSSLDDAMDHIYKHGSGHSEAIITDNYTTAQRFLQYIDAAAVYVNASTRFTDGAEFGLGAEIGISTQKLHCRGPMGLKDLTTTKYIVYGSGQIRE